MGHKKYYGYKPKHEHFETTLYKETGRSGELLTFIFEDGQCGMKHYFWGSDVDYEYSRDGEVEQIYIWDAENTKVLMLRTGTKNGEDLVNAISERFQKFKSDADSYILKWCDEKGIKYESRVWF